LVADTQFNPRVYLLDNLQYHTLSDHFGWQGRFRWIMRPGNDLLLVYIHKCCEPDNAYGFRTLDRRAADKISYTKRI